MGLFVSLPARMLYFIAGDALTSYTRSYKGTFRLGSEDSPEVPPSSLCVNARASGQERRGPSGSLGSASKRGWHPVAASIIRT